MLYYKTMATLSIPIPDDMVKRIEDLVKDGIAPNKAELVRQAVKSYLEEQAVNAVLKALKEPDLEGDLDELAGKI